MKKKFSANGQIKVTKTSKVKKPIKSSENRQHAKSDEESLRNWKNLRDELRKEYRGRPPELIYAIQGSELFPVTAPQVIQEWFLYGLGCHQGYSDHTWTKWDNDFENRVRPHLKTEHEEKVTAATKLVISTPLNDYELRDRRLTLLANELRGVPFPSEVPPALIASMDYRSVNIRGKVFVLTPHQAQIVEILHFNFKRKTPDIGIDYILEELAEDGQKKKTRLRDYFKRNNEDAYEALIVEGKRKGTVRLNMPDFSV